MEWSRANALDGIAMHGRGVMVDTVRGFPSRVKQ